MSDRSLYSTLFEGTISFDKRFLYVLFGPVGIYLATVPGFSILRYFRAYLHTNNTHSEPILRELPGLEEAELSATPIQTSWNDSWRQLHEVPQPQSERNTSRRGLDGTWVDGKRRAAEQGYADSLHRVVLTGYRHQNEELRKRVAFLKSESRTLAEQLAQSRKEWAAQARDYDLLRQESDRTTKFLFQLWENEASESKSLKDHVAYLEKERLALEMKVKELRVELRRGTLGASERMNGSDLGFRQKNTGMRDYEVSVDGDLGVGLDANGNHETYIPDTRPISPLAPSKHRPPPEILDTGFRHTVLQKIEDQPPIVNRQLSMVSEDREGMDYGTSAHRPVPRSTEPIIEESVLAPPIAILPSEIRVLLECAWSRSPTNYYYRLADCCLIVENPPMIQRFNFEFNFSIIREEMLRHYDFRFDNYLKDIEQRLHTSLKNAIVNANPSIRGLTGVIEMELEGLSSKHEGSVIYSPPSRLKLVDRPHSLPIL